MKLALLLVLPLVASASEDWVVTSGGTSPDKLLAVAVYPQTTDDIQSADGTVLLVDPEKRTIITPLAEVDSTGGGWGKTTENVACEWSSDSRLLAVNFRAGRLMSSYQLYRVSAQHLSPMELPDPRIHPKGKILDSLEDDANPGAEISLESDGRIVERRWGFMPKEGHWDDDFSRFGIVGFKSVGGELFFIYRLDEDGKPEIQNVLATPERKSEPGATDNPDDA